MVIEFERARKDESMSTKRNSYTPEQKLKIVLEVIRGDQTLAQIASKYRVHSTQIIRWKKQLLASAPAVFSDARRRKDQDTKDEKIQQLINDLGQAQHELNFFKKKAGYFQLI